VTLLAKTTYSFMLTYLHIYDALLTACIVIKSLAIGTEATLAFVTRTNGSATRTKRLSANIAVKHCRISIEKFTG